MPERMRHSHLETEGDIYGLLPASGFCQVLSAYLRADDVDLGLIDQ